MAAAASRRPCLMQMIHGFVLSQVVNVAAKLGVADHLADGPKTSHALAQDIAADPDALYRLLRACAGFGLFSEVESRTFALTPLAGCGVRRDKPAWSCE